MRRAAKVDGNHREVVQALKAAGCTVLSLAGLGQRGVPDLLVARAGKLFLIEVKDGTAAKRQQQLRADQEAWAAKWNGPVYLVKSVDGAIKVVTERHP
jgi:Holliday junction resolvase